MTFMAPGRLDHSVEATFMPDGTATSQIGPIIRGEVWHIKRMIVSTTSPQDTSLKVYRDSIADTNLVEATYSGNQDVSDSEMTLRAPETLFVQWEGGTPGERGFARVEGEREFRLTR